MKCSPCWEDTCFSAGREILGVWNPKVRHRVYNSLPPVPNLRQCTPYPFPPTVLKYILKSHLCAGLPRCFFPPGFSTKTLYAFSFAYMGRRIASTVFSKESVTTEKEWYSTMGVGRGATTRRKFRNARNVAQGPCVAQMTRDIRLSGIMKIRTEQNCDDCIQDRLLLWKWRNVWWPE